MSSLEKMGIAAKQAATSLAVAGTRDKNSALAAIANALENGRRIIIEANDDDIARAKASGMSVAMLDRLTLTDKRITQMIDGIMEIISFNDPIGEVISMSTNPSGLTIGKKRVPLGVIAIIYESRPNVTVDAAALCLKAGNSVILRGGKEAISSNIALTSLMRDAIDSVGLPSDIVALVEDTSRQSARELMELSGYVDVLIPRGGAGLIRSVVDNARVPVIETGVGNCHIYVDADANLEMGAEIIFNAKCSRPSVCNTAETLLVDRKIASAFLPMAKTLLDKYDTELRGDEETVAILGNCVTPATDDDYYREFLDYILAVKVVDGVDEAIDHIRKYSSGHSEAIVTENYTKAMRFINTVDSAAVYINASTRYTDGGEFGLGAEIGISTQKMHARGPMGLRELTSSKYVIYGNGQVR